MRRAYPQGHPEQPYECCDSCGTATEKAGAGDGSLYCDCGAGPFCEGCYDEHTETCAEWIANNVNEVK